MATRHPPRTTKNSTAAATSAQQMEEAHEQQQQIAPSGPTPGTEQQGEPAARKASLKSGNPKVTPSKEVWVTKEHQQQQRLMNVSPTFI